MVKSSSAKKKKTCESDSFQPALLLGLLRFLSVRKALKEEFLTEVYATPQKRWTSSDIERNYR